MNPEQPVTKFESTIRHVRRLEEQRDRLNQKIAELRIRAREEAIIDIGEGVHLTNRQSQILKMICANEPNKVIAASMNISVRTVKFHVATLFHKFGVASRMDLALRFTGGQGKR